MKTISKRGYPVLVKTTMLAIAATTLATAPCKATAQDRWVDVGNGWTVAVQRSDHARAYGAALTQPGWNSQRVTNIANSIVEALNGSPYQGYGNALAIGTKIVNYAFYSYWWALRLRIEWCAARSPYVYTYHYRWVPVWSYTSW